MEYWYEWKGIGILLITMGITIFLYTLKIYKKIDIYWKKYMTLILGTMVLAIGFLSGLDYFIPGTGLLEIFLLPLVTIAMIVLLYKAKQREGI